MDPKLPNLSKFRGVWSAPNLRACLSLTDGDDDERGVSLPSSPVTKKVQKTNRVSFFGSVSVVLIPTRTDYNTANLKGTLWWGAANYHEFQKGAIEEIQTAMELKRLSCKSASAQLYCGEIPCIEQAQQAEATKLQAHEQEEVDAISIHDNEMSEYGEPNISKSSKSTLDILSENYAGKLPLPVLQATGSKGG